MWHFHYHTKNTFLECLDTIENDNVQGTSIADQETTNGNRANYVTDNQNVYLISGQIVSL